LKQTLKARKNPTTARMRRSRATGMAMSRTGAKKKRPRYGEMVIPRKASSDGATKTPPLVRKRACSLAIGVVNGLPKQIH